MADTEPKDDTAASPRARSRARVKAGTAGNGTAPETAKPDTKPDPPRRAGKLEKGLADFFAMGAIGFQFAGDTHCATILTERTPLLAKELAELADKNPAVKRVLSGLVEGGAWGGVTMATLAIVLPIAQHHGLYPAQFPNPWATPDTVPHHAVTPPAPTQAPPPPRPRPADGTGAPGPAAISEPEL